MSDSGSSDPPKLYSHKPKKAQLKHKSKDFSSPPVMGTQTAPPPPPPPPKEPFIRRYKFLWPMLLAVNLGLGVYLFTRTNTKKTDTEEEEKDATPISVKDTTTAPVAETSVTLQPTANPVIKREPIPENQQRELFKWILEEKRKIKPKDAEEKRRIEEEKALLKNLLRSKSIPSI
ncbi:WAS/WASL-interacting family protein [Trifolium repens]|nr:WAS/WASL-interacting family protein [Trifolium repens]